MGDFRLTTLPFNSSLYAEKMFDKQFSMLNVQSKNPSSQLLNFSTNQLTFELTTNRAIDLMVT
jgi:hypothetical protein